MSPRTKIPSQSELIKMEGSLSDAQRKFLTQLDEGKRFPRGAAYATARTLQGLKLVKGTKRQYGAMNQDQWYWDSPYDLTPLGHAVLSVLKTLRSQVERLARDEAVRIVFHHEWRMARKYPEHYGFSSGSVPSSWRPEPETDEDTKDLVEAITKALLQKRYIP